MFKSLHVFLNIVWFGEVNERIWMPKSTKQFDLKTETTLSFCTQVVVKQGGCHLQKDMYPFTSGKILKSVSNSNSRDRVINLLAMVGEAGKAIQPLEDKNHLTTIGGMRQAQAILQRMSDT